MLLLFVPADLHPCSFYSFSQLLCFLVRKLAEIRGLEYVGSTEKEGMKSWYATRAIIWQWAICMAVIGNPNIPNFLNVSCFFPFCRSLFWDVIITSLSPIPGDGCHVCAQLANSLDGKKMLFKIITSWGSPRNSVFSGHMWAFRVCLYETHAHCICCISARLLQDCIVLYNAVGLRK